MSIDIALLALYYVLTDRLVSIWVAIILGIWGLCHNVKVGTSGVVAVDAVLVSTLLGYRVLQALAPWSSPTVA